MATSQAPLTPLANTTPAVVEIPALEPSGAQWHPRFPASNQIADCAEPFKSALTEFVDALKAAGASVTISNTYRPPERAYLMHWCWRIVNNDHDPRSVPAMPGVLIQWAHVDAAGNYLEQQSVNAAQAMVNAYGMQNLNVAPALATRHTLRLAVDMTISWTGTLTIADATGQTTHIATLPRTGMNAQLKTVGAAYGVMKYVGGASDRPHWSDNGH